MQFGQPLAETHHRVCNNATRLGDPLIEVILRAAPTPKTNSLKFEHKPADHSEKHSPNVRAKVA
ncbi:MAG: hypothetical protein HOO99_15705 [Hyphomicrobiaceae bacterium]|nr:hypothetical protein [Hyphomicrobiaceae bacterium]